MSVYNVQVNSEVLARDGKRAECLVSNEIWRIQNSKIIDSCVLDNSLNSEEANVLIGLISSETMKRYVGKIHKEAVKKLTSFLCQIEG